ncbi:MAG: hypothetical protein ABNH53_06110 [Henriciella sp.]|jgi:hypothetical protein
MIKKTIYGAAIAASFLGLQACTTFSDLEAGLSDLTGQPQTVAFDRLGYPDNQMEVGEDKVYFWGYSNSFSLTTPTTQTTTGYVGGTPFSANTTGYQTNNYNYNCSIKLIVGPDEIVKRWEYQGNIGGCSQYVKRLK